MKIKAHVYIVVADEVPNNEFEDLYQPNYEPLQPIVVDDVLDQVSTILPNSVLWQIDYEEWTFVEDEGEDYEENEQEESVDYSDEDWEIFLLFWYIPSLFCFVISFYTCIL